AVIEPGGGRIGRRAAIARQAAALFRGDRLLQQFDRRPQGLGQLPARIAMVKVRFNNAIGGRSRWKGTACKNIENFIAMDHRPSPFFTESAWRTSSAS